MHRDLHILVNELGPKLRAIDEMLEAAGIDLKSGERPNHDTFLTVFKVGEWNEPKLFIDVPYSFPFFLSVELNFGRLSFRVFYDPKEMTWTAETHGASLITAEDGSLAFSQASQEFNSNGSDSRSVYLYESRALELVKAMIGYFAELHQKAT